jgi:K+-sensing histidine kinase KdpD
LTAKDTRDNRIKGFQVGVDAYVTKPFEPEELVAAIQNIFNRVRRTHRRVARLTAAGTNAVIAAPAPVVAQLPRTIIENAIKYTPEGGRISVSAELATAEEIVVHVTDNGRGIRPEDVPHIFDKFFRGMNPKATKDPTIDGTPDDAVKPETPGVGLGLYLAERLIRALEGRIEVESSPGSGSRFSVILPVWNDALHEMDDVDEYGFEEGT